MSYLQASDMTGGYGQGDDIIKGCTLEVDKGEISVIVGPNGAGKSTAMKAVLGMLNLKAGTVMYDGEDVTKLSPQARIQKGMAFVPQTDNIFTTMTVRENLEMGAFLRNDDGIDDTINHIFDLFPILKQKTAQMAGELSGGQRQQLAFGRALMTEPKIIMLDEPTAGVSPIVVGELFDKIVDMKNSGLAILMVEQNAKQALEVADRGFVLVDGQNGFTGTGASLLANPKVRESFLGG